MKKYKCLIYESRPKICKDYPAKWTGGIIEGCTYKFGLSGELEGECNRCGKCCFLMIDILKLGSKFHMGDPCPYLEKVTEQIIQNKLLIKEKE